MYKKIFIAVFLMLSGFLSFGQRNDSVGNYKQVTPVKGGMSMVNYFQLPPVSPSSMPYDSCRTVWVTGGKIYFHDCTGTVQILSLKDSDLIKAWAVAGTDDQTLGFSHDTLTIVRGNSVYLPYLHTGDTAAMLAAYVRLNVFLDSVSALRSAINMKANQIDFQDSIAMARDSINALGVRIGGFATQTALNDTAAAHMVLINARVKYTDTGAMLAPYLRSTDSIVVYVSQYDFDTAIADLRNNFSNYSTIGQTETLIDDTANVLRMVIADTSTSIRSWALNLFLQASDSNVNGGYASYFWVKSQGYLTTNQTITLSGDVSGSGTTSITTTLASTGTPGIYAYPASITTDLKGRVTSVTAGSAPSVLTDSATFVSGGLTIARASTSVTIAFPTTSVNGTPISVGGNTSLPVGSGTVTNVIAGTNISVTGTSTIQPTVNISGTIGTGNGGTGTTLTTSVNGTPIAYGTNNSLPIGTGTVTNVIGGTNISITGTSTLQPTVNISGTIGMGNGGTGSTLTTSVNGTPVNYGVNNTLPIGTGTVTSVSGTSGQIAVTTGTTTPVISIVSSATLPGSPTVATPGTASGSVATIDGTQILTNKTITSSTDVLGGVTMTLGSDANLDMYYRNSGVLTRLPVGLANQEIAVNSGATGFVYVTPISASSTNTFTNKRWTARVGSTTSSGTPTINTDNYDVYKLTAQAANITSMTSSLSGTPNDGDVLVIEITGTGTYTLAWGASFVSSTATLPTAITTTTITVILRFSSTSSYGTNKWICASSF